MKAQKTARPPGLYIRQLRERLDLSQEQLGIRAGWGARKGRTRVSRIESGANQASSAATLQGLAAGFGLTLEQVVSLLNGSLAIEDAYDARSI